jgi:sodium transport system permease protein
LNSVWCVLRKELRETLRDRRSLFTTLIIGPVLMPALIGTVIFMAIRHSGVANTGPITLTVAHAERAPRLLNFLRQYQVRVRPISADRARARRLVARQQGPLLYVPRDFGARLAAGKPAPLRLYADDADRSVQGKVERLSTLIGLYSGTIARLRLVARGLDPQLLAPIALHPIDTSTPQSRAALTLGMLSYAILFTMLMSGLYIAIDTTAGERERGSLEPLLTVPVKREHLVYGKMLAACAMMLVSLILTVAAFALTLRHIGLARLGMSANFGPGVAAGIVLGCLPLIPAGAALMTLVASYTRSYREAQTYVGLVLLVPTLPLIFANILGLQPRAALMAVPSLSQHFIIMSLLRAQPLPSGYVAISAGVSLALGVVLVYLAGRLYRRERLLG